MCAKCNLMTKTNMMMAKVASLAQLHTNGSRSMTTTFGSNCLNNCLGDHYWAHCYAIIVNSKKIKLSPNIFIHIRFRALLTNQCQVFVKVIKRKSLDGCSLICKVMHSTLSFLSLSRVSGLPHKMELSHPYRDLYITHL